MENLGFVSQILYFHDIELLSGNHRGADRTLNARRLLRRLLLIARSYLARERTQIYRG